MTFDEVLTKFDYVERRDTDAMCRCPHHADGKASLSVSQGRDGVVLHCHAGCDTRDILTDIGLTWADLIDKPKNSNGNARRIAATYDYVDEHSQLLFQKVRYEPKDFRVRRPDGKGGWTYSIGDTRRVLYHLPEVIAAAQAGRTIWIVEGEKDCDALARAGETATCNFDGAGKWKPEYTSMLAELGVTLIQIVADDDPPGHKHAFQIRDALSAAGIPTTMWLPAKGHKDIADHLGAGRNITELSPLELAPEYRANTIEPAPDHFAETGFIKKYTDDHNAVAFVKAHGHVVRYVPEWGTWLRWDGTRWRRDKTRSVVELARETARAIYFDALGAPAEEAREAKKWAAASGNTPRLHAMLDLARSAPGIPVLAADLDADPWLLNVANGTINLRTGELRPHRQDDLITKIGGCPFDLHADAPRFETFLAQILPDPEVRAWLQAYAGYCLTGLTTEQLLPFAHGPGANGKTTLINAVLDVMGDYAQHADPDLLTETDGTHPTGRADLQGARFVVLSELEDGRRLAESTVKQLTGGDRIKARYMRQDFFEFEPTHKFLVATNYKPTVRGSDYAIWRRIRLIPFSVIIDKADQDPNLQHALHEEATGILTWLVAGCQMWQARGLPTPGIVQAATDSYRYEEDRIGAFLADCCDLTDPVEYVSAEDLYKAYSDWATANGERPFAMKRLGGHLTQRGLDRKKLGERRRWHWLGIRLLPAETPSPEPF